MTLAAYGDRLAIGALLLSERPSIFAVKPPTVAGYPLPPPAYSFDHIVSLSTVRDVYPPPPPPMDRALLGTENDGPPPLYALPGP